MTGKRNIGFFSLLVFIAVLILIVIIVRLPQTDNTPVEPQAQTKVVVPQAAGAMGDDENPSGAEADDGSLPKVVLGDGESAVAVITGDFDGDSFDEQVIAFRNLAEQGSPIHISYVVYDRRLGGYTRVWTGPTAAARPATVSLDVTDMVGDHGFCVLVSGMNAAAEETLTVYRYTVGSIEPFALAAELAIDGTVSVQTAQRSQAYGIGQTDGQSNGIVVYGRDPESENSLDRVEVTYSYNYEEGRYEESARRVIPGRQAEQNLVQSLLSGGQANFQQYLTGLWYYVSPSGAIEGKQYIYFDPENSEITFYTDNTWQVYIWESANMTRTGIYISSRNDSVVTLRRMITAELEASDSIRLRVTEPINMRIGTDTTWNGSYRRASRPARSDGRELAPVEPHMEAEYRGAMGRFLFHNNGVYEIISSQPGMRGQYSFFDMEGQEILELRPGPFFNLDRETYLVNRLQTPDGEELRLVRVVLSTTGIVDPHEATVTLVGGPVVTEEESSEGDEASEE
jgi:hypothetical protein